MHTPHPYYPGSIVIFVSCSIVVMVSCVDSNARPRVDAILADEKPFLAEPRATPGFVYDY
jgi:hypothetical protein